MNSILPLYDIHPISIKLIRKGHPWIIKDKFTEKFQPRDRFIVAKDKKRPFSLLLHDPKHSQIKARLWSTTGDFNKQIKNFKKDLSYRIDTAIKKRSDLSLLESRENIYLIFAEADMLPGIKVNLLGKEILIQFYSFFWENYEDLVSNAILKSIHKHIGLELYKENIWIQYRADSGKKKLAPKCLDPNLSFKTINLTEFDVKYELHLGKNYDPGIYTDMSAIRKDLYDYFKNSKSVLNLFAYTGAFSLFALAQGAEEVCSIDISEQYIQELIDNIKLNEFDLNKHIEIISSVNEGLNQLTKDERKFDLIISDPPTSSSDKKKRTNSLRDYETTLPQMCKVLNEKGSIVAFLNTHTVNKRKFEQKIQEIIKDKNLKLKITKHLKQKDDCPTLKGFPEGTYLKGLVLTHDPR